jgi:hypothetical protein
MCMEDVRLARQTTTRVTDIVGDSGVWVPLCGQEPDRYSLLIQLGGASDVQLRCGASGLPVGGAVIGTDPNTVLLLDLQHHGDMVTQPWYVYSSSNAVLAVVTESTLRIR